MILDVVFDRGLLFLVVENLGDRPAHAVRIKFDKPFTGVGGTKQMQRLALFRKLEFLAPHKSIEVFLDRSASYFARDEPTQLTAVDLVAHARGRPPQHTPSTTTSRSTATSGSSRGRFPVPVRRDNPYANFNFVVEIDGVEAGGFSEVDLPSGEIEVIEYREGADRVSSARKLPGRVKYANVVLKRGVAGTAGALRVVEVRARRRARPAQRRDRAARRGRATRVQRWLLRNAWPAKVDYSRLEGLGNEVAIETLELAHEGFETE